MSVLKTLKLGKAAPTPAPADAKGRARAKVVAHLEQQKALLAAHIEGKAFEATRPVYRTLGRPGVGAIRGAGVLNRTLTALVWTVRGEAGLIAAGAAPA